MKSQQNISGLLISLMVLGLIPVGLFAREGTGADGNFAEQVDIVRDGDSYRLRVEGEDYAIRGVVWDYTPIGENYNYDLWNEPDDFIRELLDRDAELMSAMGVNTIRTFSLIPPRWVTYLYMRWGIRSIINPLFGRYGTSARGRWNDQTDYSDRYQREAVLEETLDVVERYRNTPGVLMFLFGNENNYGLEWQSPEIEDLPRGEEYRTRAAYLYTLFETAIRRAGELDSKHPIGFINGDLQYADLMADIVVSADLIGINSYRGAGFGDLFERARELGKPIVFTEFGADAYNVLTRREDQAAQQHYIVNQWREIYQNAGPKGTGNVLGGFVFSWSDGWWKHDQPNSERAEIHDTAGTWSNGAYAVDFNGTIDNMNEEWFGIVGLVPNRLLRGSFLNRIEEREPRSVYYALREFWTLDLYESSIEEADAMAEKLTPLPAEEILRRGEANAGGFTPRGVITVDHLNVELEGSALVEARDGRSFAENLSKGTPASKETLAAVIAARPFDNFYAAARFKLVGNHFNPYFTDAPNENYGGKTLQLYWAEAMYDGSYFDINGYYRNGHPDWAAEGDYFFMLPESYDKRGIDIAGSRAPFGVEFVGNRFLDGLKIYGGPEIYRGAKPQIITKYRRSFGLGPLDTGFTAIYAEEFSRADGDPAARNPAGEPDRRASLYNYWNWAPFLRLDWGIYFAGMNKLGRQYYFGDSANTLTGTLPGNAKIKTAEVGILDTLALKMRLSTEIFRYTNLYVQGIMAGGAADSSAAVSRDGFIRSDSGKGNRTELEAGGMFQYDIWSIGAKARFRHNIHPALPGGSAFKRSAGMSPFVVTPGNRPAFETELLLGVDPTGATYFHNYDMADNENARAAAALALLWTVYAGATDPADYTAADGSKGSFPRGLDEQRNMWAAQLKVVTNPGAGLHLVGNLALGREGSTGSDNTDLRSYVTGGLDGWWGPVIFKSFVKHNFWGPESWYREFNTEKTVFPWQWGVDVGLALDGKPSLLETISKFGVKVEARHYNPEHKSATDPNVRLGLGVYLNLVLVENRRPKLRGR